ncbi:biopolymer transporter ExbD [Sphingomonas sabuli]|uniref:Biopolymer transporter ExbD n=1 Tax=Sphingomonas sabuli TaxID=2764186 RepID=A0A7G9L4W0_9SPHN|nr:biopolymer transporter ExbD [Sphingomonas sabuli]QNM83659.1 biopolymer transporter ExbD [Sphingomonas sabuli]
MAMSVGPADGDEDAISDINVIPLADTMLVMLIIFLVTVPVILQTVPVKLPNVRYEATTTKPENVNLSVRGDGAGGCEVYWNLTKVNSDELLERGVKKLEDQIAKVGGAENLTDETMPEAHIRGDVTTPWKCVGGAIFAMQRAGFARIGFISEPPPQAGYRAN